MADSKSKLSLLQDELAGLSGSPNLQPAISDIDDIIKLLSDAREQVLQAHDPHTASLIVTKLQNPVNDAFNKVNNDLNPVSKLHKKIGKVLDKHFPVKPLPADHDAMADHPALINRAIAMHLLREGQFSVASTFVHEAKDTAPSGPHTTNPSQSPPDDFDEPMHDHGVDLSDGEENNDEDDVGPPAAASNGTADRDLTFESAELQPRFSEMYNILQQLKARNLVPAIEWARSNSIELEGRGSNLEFELSKLQYVWLFKGPLVNGLPDNERNGRAGALAYARDNFSRFQARHLGEIQKLASAMVFAPNLPASPYDMLFDTTGAFADVASSFTREFCSLLGLSAESPLYLAATAGALALPRLVKYTEMMRTSGTEWTTANEMAFETPLPERMLYHSIFVCPVSKDQTTDSNPPMMITCGHVLARDTLIKLCKGNRFKCPYCPAEGQFKDARQIVL